MQIVIDIDEEIYKRTLPYKNISIFSDYSALMHVVANGVPLPKGHGRLIDADEINLQDISPVDGFSVYGATAEDIDLTPTVLEAESEET